ncbi:MAG: carbamoyltransferase HypF [Candidatus Aureabacteria bacterium]|nr:carbamoyltransferase HypF [Candidatus Auribacterota bacterium]
MKYNKTILALGADIKNRALVARGDELYFCPDVGDLSDARNYEFFRKNISALLKKLKLKPDIIASDRHPGYFSSQFAEESAFLFARKNIRLKIQHHHAHIASVLYENSICKPVLGVSFDGTGYGDDGNIWGGEFLLVESSSYKRLAHFKYIPLAGGDRVVHEPWRIVLGVLGRDGKKYLKNVSEKDKCLVLNMIEKNINVPLSSSAGRLFDAASALMGICTHASFEAEAAIKLESLCREGVEKSYPFKSIQKDGSMIIDSGSLFYHMLEDLKRKEDVEIMATKFHNSMADIIVSTVKRLSQRHHVRDIALSGGVFQNRFLRTKVKEKLSGAGFQVFLNKEAGSSDINISLGQYHVSCCSWKN